MVILLDGWLVPFVFLASIGMMIVLVLSAQGILGRIISWVVYPAQGLLLAPVRAIWG